MHITSRDIEIATNKYPDLPPRAALVAEFIETYCTLSRGPKISTPFKLLGWQFKILKNMYPGMPGDPRVINRVLASMARKNGKTEFASTLVLTHLCGPESGVGREIVTAAAASKEQASLVWDGAKTMVENHPALRPHIKIYHPPNKRMIWKPGSNNSYVVVKPSRAGAVQGLLPSFVTFDEIAETSDRALWESYNYADADPEVGLLIFIISTRSNKPDSMFKVLHDEAVFGQTKGVNKHWYIKVWSADIEKPLYTMEQVEAANPSMGVNVKRETLEKHLENAKNFPSARAEFRARVLNIETGKTDSLLDHAQWQQHANELIDREELYKMMEGKDVVLGLDLGDTTSMTSLALYFPDENLLSVVNWMCESLLEDNAIKHSAPYADWAKDGRLMTAEQSRNGKGMDYQSIAAYVKDIFSRFNVLSLRYDGWKEQRLFDCFEKVGMYTDTYPLANTLDRFEQNMYNYNEAITQFSDLIHGDGFRHDNDPVTNMGVLNCVVKTRVNSAGEEMVTLTKDGQSLPNDPAAAMLMATCKRSLAGQKPEISDEFISKMYGVDISKHTPDAGIQDLIDIIKA